MHIQALWPFQTKSTSTLFFTFKAGTTWQNEKDNGPQVSGIQDLAGIKTGDLGAYVLPELERRKLKRTEFI